MAGYYGFDNPYLSLPLCFHEEIVASSSTSTSTSTSTFTSASTSEDGQNPNSTEDSEVESESDVPRSYQDKVRDVTEAQMRAKNSQHKNKIRKQILFQIPKNHIVAGEISFTLHYKCYLGLVPELKITLIVYDQLCHIDPAFEIDCPLIMKHYSSASCITNLTQSAFDDLLSDNYTWVVEDIMGFSKKLVKVKIAFPAHKGPIYKAKNVVEFFLQKSFPTYTFIDLKKVASVETFLKKMKLFQGRNELLCDANVNVQHEKLKPILCPYQAKAVLWMLRREHPTLQPQNSDWRTSVLEPLYTTKHYSTVYQVYIDCISEAFEFPPLPRGGILADEMGLGKTVAVIALILNNPRTKSSDSDFGEYLNPVLTERRKKICPLKLMRKNSDGECSEKDKNMEDHLSPHEELVASRATRGSAMKRALTKWYESALAEYSTSKPNKTPRTSTNLIKCLCGDSDQKKNDLCVQCPECKRLQHASCVAFEENFLYFCPVCWTKQRLIKSDATLIISPPNIYYQWYDEINKHVAAGTFSKGIFMYDDIKSNFIQPSVLASYDIIICTYTRLRTEFNHSPKAMSSRKLRQEERFLKKCSPLAQVNWWRLVLDEAQMVEAERSAIGQMAKLIPAVNRWSVTGTPIQKSVNDIFHLIDFLRVKPFSTKHVWNNLLYVPYLYGNMTPLCCIMSDIFWRNSKDTVSDELFIPEQTAKYHFLKFTAIEQNFYMREHVASSTEFNICLRKSNLSLETTIDSLDRKTLSKILNPLLNLRQACSHFLAVKGNKISSKTGNMTMTDLFKYLHNKTKVECEEELRKYIAALNGLAGISCIQEEWIEAVEYYRRVLQISEEYKGKVEVDSLQRIHTLTNLAEVLEYHGEDVAPTLRDDTIKDEAKQLEEKYMGKISGELKSEEKLMSELSKKVNDLENSLSSHSEIWWVHLISVLTVQDAMEEVIDKISAELLANQTESRKSIDIFLSKVSTPKLVEVLMRNWLKSVKDNRRKVIKRLESLKEESCDNLVSQAVDCHLRINNLPAKKTKCGLCICENDLLEYECCLFAVSRKNLKEEYEKVLDGAQTKGSWKAHKAERVLRVILNVAKNKTSTEVWALTDGRTHMNLLECMKREFKQLRVVWMSLNHHVQARDEVDMCKIRLRLRFPEEPLPPKPAKLNLKEQSKVETVYIIESHEIEAQRLNLTAEIEVSKSGFIKKFGALMYLENVGKKENPIPDPCPVCKSALNNEWCVLQCGHCYCIECIRTLLIRNYKPSISCPICREVTKSSDLSFVDLSGGEENSDITVVGEHSTKIEAVVRTVLALKQKEENVKVLIFSTWAVVLRVLAVALEQNGVSFRRLPGPNYQTCLKEFKDRKLNITALLLPFTWGSKGLNLIEATHVFLIEPIMNPAEELQALGRVHRIGQKNKTFVHRFLIRGTIEEKIHSAVSEAKDKWDKKNVTLEDLKNLYDIKQGLVDSDKKLNPENDD